MRSRPELLVRPPGDRGRVRARVPAAGRRRLCVDEGHAFATSQNLAAAWPLVAVLSAAVALGSWWAAAIGVVMASGRARRRGERPRRFHSQPVGIDRRDGRVLRTGGRGCRLDHRTPASRRAGGVGGPRPRSRCSHAARRRAPDARARRATGRDTDPEPPRSHVRATGSCAAGSTTARPLRNWVTWRNSCSSWAIGSR